MFFPAEGESGLLLVMLACKASLSSTSGSSMLSNTMLGNSFVGCTMLGASLVGSSSIRQLSSSAVRLGGQKAKRRKQTLRANNPHLPVR